MKNLIIVLVILCIEAVQAAPTKVGNGDAGGDLEQMEKVSSGILISTRDAAISLLQSQKIENIKGLSRLVPELQKADIYLAQSNVSPVLKTDSQEEISADGRFVYARTFAEPLAPVRFFPAAMLLTEKQLINLHIHEALHRSLPAEINQNESAVSEITLALTSEGASYDRTTAVLDKYLASSSKSAMADGATNVSSGSSIYAKLIQPTERLKAPSHFSYSYTSFDISKEDKIFLPVTGMHSVESLLYPFGDDSSVRGLGLHFSYLNLEDKSLVGPLGVSLNYLFATWRGFDVEGFGRLSLYSLSEEELKNLPKTRDNLTVGLSIKKDAPAFYTENFIAITSGGEKKFKIGNVSYIEDYRPAIDARFEVGKKIGSFSMGVFGDFLLTEGSVVQSRDGLFESERERVRAIKVGPRVGYDWNNLRVQVAAQSLIDKTPGYSMTEFGDLMGVGAGNSSVSGSLQFNY